MKHHSTPGRSMRQTSLLGAMFLALALSVVGNAQAAFAQQAVAAKPAAVASVFPPTAAVSQAAKPAAEEEETAKPDKLGEQGVKVHGHWLMVLKNPDGTVVDRREFENSLVTNTYNSGGDDLIISLLTGEATPGGFAIGMITVNTTSNPDPATWCSDSGSVGKCYMLTQANNAYFGPSTTKQTGLTTSTAIVTPNGNGTLPRVPEIVLAGNFTIPSGLTTLNAVATYQATCFPPAVGLNNANIPTTQCIYPVPSQDNTGINTFTATVIGGSAPAPLTNLIAGQILQVSVTLSFS